MHLIALAAVQAQLHQYLSSELLAVTPDEPVQKLVLTTLENRQAPAKRQTDVPRPGNNQVPASFGLTVVMPARGSRQDQR